MRTSASSLLWITDADNTLWDTDSVFANAQLALLEAMEAASGQPLESGDRLRFVREIDQGIAAQHHRGLRYSAELLALGVWERLSGRSLADSVRRALNGSPSSSTLRSVSEAFSAGLCEVPSLRPGVIEGLIELRDRGADIIVASEGSKARIERTLTHHNVASFVRMCIEAPKTTELFRRLATASERKEPWMIGDQLDRDIVPSRAAGYRTVYFPGSFMPHWHRSEDAGLATISVTNYLDGAIAACSSSIDRLPATMASHGARPE